MKLYEITDEILLRVADAEEEGNLQADLDSLEMEFVKKVEGCAKVIRNLNAEAEMLKTEAIRLSRRAQSAFDRAIWLKDYVKSQMERLGLRKVTAGIFKVRIQKSPLRIDIVDEESVPLDFKKKIELWNIDKKGIAELVKETGSIPPGVKVEQGTHLRIS